MRQQQWGFGGSLLRWVVWDFMVVFVHGFFGELRQKLKDMETESASQVKAAEDEMGALESCSQEAV